MALVAGDILQFTDQQTYLNQRVLNIYTYRYVEGDPETTYVDVAQQFELVVITAVRNIQSQSLQHTTLIVKNLTNGLDIWEEPVNQPGAVVSTDNAPSFTAAAVRLIRSTALTRHGQKRYAGLPDASINGNSLMGTSLTNMPALLTAVGSDVVRSGTSADLVLEPVIVGRIQEGDPDAGQYDLSKINPVSAAQYIRLTTQTTRREGRGI